MKLQGAALLSAPRELVWQSLTDTAFLAKCLPGAQELTPDGPGRYKVSMKMGIAAFSGKFEGAVHLADQHCPESFKMSVEGRGAAGFMKGEGTLTLREKGGQTEVQYNGKAQVGGVIASVGSRMIEAAAKKIVQQFFDAAAAELRGANKR
jgi:uncharacterized protein